MTRPYIGQSDGKSLVLDLERLIDSRLLVQARSGGGKSWLLRRLAEQTYGQVQQIILDCEGEFSTLREKHDYIVAAAQGGDTLAHPRTAALLARRLLELGVSAVVDLYELKAHERPRFIKLFLDSMMNAPKSLWHPCMVVVDEAHVFAPQTGSAESLQSVIDLATRGRKRGYCAVLATQRLSKLHKDAAAEMQNKLVGGTSLDVDVKRAADELGMNTKDAVAELRNLKPGEFFAYGPALSQTVVRVQVGEVKSTHPKAGQRGTLAPIVAPSKKIEAALAKLSDLPKEAEQEQKTNEELRKELADTKRKLTLAGNATPVAKALPPKIVKEPTPFIPRPTLHSARRINKHAEALKAEVGKLFESFADLAKIPVEQTVFGTSHVAQDVPRQMALNREARAAVRRVESELGANNGSLRSGARRILQELCARHPATYSRSQVAVLTGFTASGGTFNTYLSDLRRGGYMEERGDQLSAAQAGFDYLGADVPERPTTHEAMMAMWRKALRAGAYKMLEAVVEERHSGLTRLALAESVGMEPTGGTFNTYLSDLRRNELIAERDGVLTPLDILFP